jgi:4-aminobutyrate aminotransferase-like enzyme
LLADKLKGVPGVTEVRGIGLMIGIELESHELSETVAQLCFRRGLIVLECGKKAIRISPPLILTEAQAAVTAEIFAKAVADARAAAAA